MKITSYILCFLVKEQAKNLTESITSLQNELSTITQHHQLELWEQQERLKVQSQRALQSRSTAHQEEVTALMKEWNQERKVAVMVMTKRVTIKTSVSCICWSLQISLVYHYQLICTLLCSPPFHSANIIASKLFKKFPSFLFSFFFSFPVRLEPFSFTDFNKP